MKYIIGFMVIALVIIAFRFPSASNFDRLVLGESNFGEDPNVTADITFQNDEYVSNSTNGVIELNAASLNVNSTVAGIDSFTTSSTVDTITSTSIAVGDIFAFAEYTPAYSTAIDTIAFGYKTESGRVLVYRSGVSNAVAYKSGALYSFIRLK